jgi:hypothetical protein
MMCGISDQLCDLQGNQEGVKQRAFQQGNHLLHQRCDQFRDLLKLQMEQR